MSKMGTEMVTGYVQGGDLYLYDTAERLRKATASEAYRSAQEPSGTGAIRTEVSVRTILRCPMAAAIVERGGRL